MNEVFRRIGGLEEVIEHYFLFFLVFRRIGGFKTILTAVFLSEGEYDFARSSLYQNTKGFRMLALGGSDGNSFLPLSRCMLSAANRANRL